MLFFRKVQVTLKRPRIPGQQGGIVVIKPPETLNESSPFVPQFETEIEITPPDGSGMIKRGFKR